MPPTGCADTICDAFAMRQVDLIVVALCYGAATVATVATFVLLICVP